MAMIMIGIFRIVDPGYMFVANAFNAVSAEPVFQQ
jgi:hypothetical protein